MVSKHLEFNVSKWQMLQDGGHIIQLNTADNTGKTTVTAGAVRKIAGIKRGPPHRTIGRLSVEARPVKMPTQLQTDIERANKEHNNSAPHEPPDVGADGPTEASAATPNRGASDSFQADSSGIF